MAAEIDVSALAVQHKLRKVREAMERKRRKKKEGKKMVHHDRKELQLTCCKSSAIARVTLNRFGAAPSSFENAFVKRVPAANIDLHCI